MDDRHVRKSVNLPVVKTDDDFIYCQRLVNEALLELIITDKQVLCILMCQ